MKTFRILLFLLAVILTGAAFAQTYDEWVKQREQAYQNFLNERDKALYEFLKNSYYSADISKPVPVMAKPKPSAPPVFKDAAEPEPGITSDNTAGMPPPVITPPPPPAVPEHTKSAETAEETGNRLEITFYGSRYYFPVMNFRNLISAPVTGDKIADQFAEISSKAGESGFGSMKKIIGEITARFDGYNAVRLLTLAGERYGLDKNSVCILIWHLLNSTGFDVRLGFSEKGVYLLAATDYPLYNLPFLTGNGKKYYFTGSSLPGTDEGFWFYDSPESGTKKLGMIPKLTPGSCEKLLITREVPVFEDTVRISYELCAEDVRLTQNFPATSPEVYFEAGLDRSVLAELKNKLSPLLEGKSETEKIEILLRFTQLAGDYKTDDEQFGKEKPMFLHEFLYYSASDCEDRSLFFAWLVTSILNLETLILGYDDHAATAVLLKKSAPGGDYITYKGRDYLICDPTYIYASAGKSMPAYQNAKPEITELHVSK